MLVILPFEKAFYQEYGVDATFVGHPLLDALYQLPPGPKMPEKPLIALLPGSRKQEIQRILPVMLSATPFFPEYQFVIAGASSIPDVFYTPFLNDYPSVRVDRKGTYPLLQQAQAALVKSGTSTLETALLNVPQVVCYAGNPISYHIAKRVIQVKYISLVNLILDEALVTELIQDQLNTDNVVNELRRILEQDTAQQLKNGYARLRTLLGEGGASQRAAAAILSK
jgi:lipid-A-disaccharide synthase